jgi:exopolysaccharide biosynthesis protein
MRYEHHGPFHMLTIPRREIARMLVTPDMYLMRTSEIAKVFLFDVAINGDQWRGTTSGGFWASHGQIWNDNRTEPTLYLGKGSQLSFKRPRKIWNAVSGNHMIMAKGKQVPTLDVADRMPRTAIGLDRWGRTLFIVVVDGNEAQGTGATLDDLYTTFKIWGAYDAMNMDGGGSSTLTIAGRIINIPSDDNIPGRERPVINHLGIWLKEPLWKQGN